VRGGDHVRWKAREEERRAGGYDSICCDRNLVDHVRLFSSEVTHPDSVNLHTNMCIP
jgi:hypothetical protein